MAYITDRTELDVIMGTSKGNYGAADLNRVEFGVGRISDTLGLGLSVKTDWMAPGDYDPNAWPVESQMARYLENIRSIQMVFGLGFIRLPASMDRLTYVTANNIERILSRAEQLTDGILSTYRYSGELIAGEE